MLLLICPYELKDKFYWHDNNGEKHGTILVNFAGHYIETTQFRADGNYSDGRHPDSVEFSKSFEEDTKRRDFTINAIGLDADGKIVDFQNGQKDIEAGIIRAVGDPVARFNEDALRILRALRFASRFMFTIEWNTARAIQETKHKLTLIARERIGDEIRKASEYGDTQFEHQKIVKVFKFYDKLPACVDKYTIHTVAHELRKAGFEVEYEIESIITSDFSYIRSLTVKW